MTKPQTNPNNNLIPILIIAGLFFIFGFVTWINGALIPFMKTINELTDAQSYLVASASYISFVVMALPASFILNKIGYKKGMSLGLIIMAIGALVFIPAAEARTYWVFLTGIFIQGMGMTLLQTASNPYITILGPIESGAKRIAIMGIANKVARCIGFYNLWSYTIVWNRQGKDTVGNRYSRRKRCSLGYHGRQCFYAISCHGHSTGTSWTFD